MPSEDYASVARGPLKLKGAKVKKHKKTKTKTKSAVSDLEKNLSTGGDSSSRSTDENALVTTQDNDTAEEGARGRKRTHDSPEEEKDDTVAVAAEEADGQTVDDNKTEAERRFAEIKRKRLKELTGSARVRPELLKTHKQRVEELNSHLSRLSEHHDMPKIGPG
ncbi:hypothetical protein B0T17DRAFT_515654 [Bombardia bombarda]|uniref:DUF1754-domain-containing protein n=1 Tax=Bombardia bombarda TaxID=252184 RepID=A0AA39XK93_9PEZI|nr:hypothetical protein B0T17DRAFT_515654 [Bombardia bombarda]